MRKLTVKNFSVIKEAELEFGKITVLIGPQSSGKSLLFKLAYFLSKEVLEIAVGRVLNDFDFPTFEEDVTKRFREWFPVGGWGEGDWTVSLISEDYEVTASGRAESSGNSPVFRVTFGQAFRDEYRRQLSNARPWARSLIHSGLSRLMGRAFWDDASYFPSERSYFVDTQKGYRLLASQPDPIASRFAAFYANSLNSETSKDGLSRYLEGELVRGGDSWLFSFNDGRVLPLNLLSTGSKELLPLLCGLEMYSHKRRVFILDDQVVLTPQDLARFDDFFIEEPEAHIFPEKQYEVVQYFAEIVNDEVLRPAISITTHSPYILSSFNNLLEAWQTGHINEERANAVRKVIDEKYWINPSEFRAYAIKDAFLSSIIADDTKLIRENYLDSVSETIGAEFDELLRIGYVEA